MAKTTYVSCEQNGPEGAERVANMYRNQGYTVTIEHGQVGTWGSNNPYASNYGQTEPGYKIIVEKPNKKK